jgi:hypothetical protein
VSVRAYRAWVEQQRRMTFEDYMQRPGEDAPPQLKPHVEDELFESDTSGEDADDAFARMMAHKAQWGMPTAESSLRLLTEAQAEAARWAHLMPGARPQEGEDTGVPLGHTANSWVSMGPTDARFQFNGTRYTQVDSGRISGIAVHPQHQNIAYISTTGGGVWKTHDLFSPDPLWHPVSETIGNLAVGTLEMDPTAPDTLYIGLGDLAGDATPGGQLLKSTDGGGAWSAPMVLRGTYPAGSGGITHSALRVRAIKVDPNAPNIVLVGTEVGLFRSTDAGTSFQLVDLPNAGATQTPDAIWNIAYTGHVNGVSRWALSGTAFATPTSAPPTASGAVQGDIWLSSDAGQSWSSRLAANGLPDYDNNPATLPDASRVSIAAGGPAADPDRTVLFALVTRRSNVNNGGGIWRSVNGGATWQDVSGNGQGDGVPRNTTVLVPSECGSVNVHNVQGWYNSTIAVDPGDDNRVLLGGTFCGLRTLNGLAGQPTWENVSHWLPTSTVRATTDDGILPYVHADWHRTLIIRTGTGYMAFAGTDGGLFTSTNILNPGKVNQQTVSWRFPNRGLVTHLMYNVASGDPVTGNQFIAFTGLQDNGTRFRDTLGSSTTFNQVIGGDGIGVAVSKVGSDTIYWGTVQNSSTRWCVPSEANNGCNEGVAGTWQTRVPPLPPAAGSCAGDGVTFLSKVIPIRAGNRPGAITGTTVGVFRLLGTAPSAQNTWQHLGQCINSNQVRALGTSATVEGLYGVAASGGRFRVMSGCTLDTPPASCVWTSTNLMGVDTNGNGTVDTAEAPTFTNSIDFPPNHTNITPGDTFVGSSVAPIGGLPPGQGRVYLTRDRGQTWTNISGNLPDVPVNVVRYDLSDTTNQTLFAGTNLGVYRTTNGGATWERYGAGLPLVRVTDMIVGLNGGLLRISTFGRGMWEIYPSATAERGVAGNGDFDRNGQLDFVDLLSTANRLGTTPATEEQPYYDWNQDLVGTSNTVDEDDLTQLKNRFGGRP